MGGKEVKTNNDASRIKWQTAGSSHMSSLRSSQQELHVPSAHEQERQTGPAAVVSKSYIRNIDEQNYWSQPNPDHHYHAGGGVLVSSSGESGKRASIP